MQKNAFNLLLRKMAAEMRQSFPVWDAVAKGDEARMDELIGAGADVNAACPDGRVPLMLALSTGKHGAAAILLAAGADPMAQDRLGLSAADHACFAIEKSGLDARGKSEWAKAVSALLAPLPDALECKACGLLSASQGGTLKEVLEKIAQNGATPSQMKL